MKKVIAFFMCALICLSVCACTSKKTNHDASSSGASYKEQTSSEAETSSEQSSSSEDTSTKLPQKTSSKDNASKNTNSKNTSSKKNTLNNDRRPIDTWLTPTIPSGNTSSKLEVAYGQGGLSDHLDESVLRSRTQRTEHRHSEQCFLRISSYHIHHFVC